MRKELNHRQLIEQIAYRAKLSTSSVEKVYENLFLIITEELRFTGGITLRDIGRFTTVPRGGKDKNLPTPDGRIIKKYIEPYYAIKFKPSANFKNFANGKIVDKDSKKNIKRKGKLSKRDLQLMNYKVEDRDRNLEIEIDKLLNGSKEKEI